MENHQEHMLEHDLPNNQQHDHCDHVHDHDQVHDHDNVHGHDHQHDHVCDHDHPHDHHHDNEHGHEHWHHHEHAEGTSKEETLALLAYMVSHNKHHAEELANLAMGMEGEAALTLQKAIAHFQKGNQELEAALKLLQQETI